MSSDRTTQEEIRRFLSGDPPSLARVRDAIDAALRRFRFLTGESRSDLVQEAMARLCESLKEGRFRGDASLATYAQTIARYTSLDLLRRRRAETLAAIEAAAAGTRPASPEDALLRKEEHEHNRHAFESLPEESRRLLLLIFVEGLHYRDVAARLGISETALKSRVYRCRLALRAASPESETPTAAPGSPLRGSAGAEERT